jgi:hypothetical protein
MLVAEGWSHPGGGRHHAFPGLNPMGEPGASTRPLVLLGTDRILAFLIRNR